VTSRLIATAWRYCEVLELIFSELSCWGSKNLWTIYGQCNNHWKLPLVPLIQYTKFHTHFYWLYTRTMHFPYLLSVHPPVMSFPAYFLSIYRNTIGCHSKHFVTIRTKWTTVLRTALFRLCVWVQCKCYRMPDCVTPSARSCHLLESAVSARDHTRTPTVFILVCSVFWRRLCLKWMLG